MPDAIGKSPFAYKTFILFCLVAVTTLIGTPLFGYVYGYTLFDWVLFSILYLVTGLGITVGYHRLISHRSFECHPWVKAFLLMAGGWALQNSALRWCSDHIRHHARTDQEEDPYNAKKGFWHSHCVWLFIQHPASDGKLRAAAAERPDDHVAAPPLSRHRHLGARVSLRPGVFPRRRDRRHRVFSARRHVPNVHGPELHVRDQFPLSHVWHAAAWPGGQQPRQLARLLSCFTFGEGYHNYHHTYARDYRNGPRWYNVDPSKWTIYTLSVLGLATNLRRLDSTVLSSNGLARSCQGQWTHFLSPRPSLMMQE